jgi:hypothetical protein
MRYPVHEGVSHHRVSQRRQAAELARTRRRLDAPDRRFILAEPEVIMRLANRLVFAFIIVIADTLAFAIPLAALLLAYVLLARPPWFRDWVERLYRTDPR